MCCFYLGTRMRVAFFWFIYFFLLLNLVTLLAAFTSQSQYQVTSTHSEEKFTYNVSCMVGRDKHLNAVKDDKSYSKQSLGHLKKKFNVRRRSRDFQDGVIPGNSLDSEVSDQIDASKKNSSVGSSDHADFQLANSNEKSNKSKNFSSQIFENEHGGVRVPEKNVNNLQGYPGNSAGSSTAEYTSTLENSDYSSTSTAFDLGIHEKSSQNVSNGIIYNKSLFDSTSTISLESVTFYGSPKMGVVSVWIYECSNIQMGPHIVSSNVTSLHLFSNDVITLHEDWAVKSHNLTDLSIWAAKGLHGINTCGWWPENLHSLDISHSSAQTLNFTGCSEPPSALKKLTVSGMSLEVAHICMPQLEILDVSWNSLHDMDGIVDCVQGLSGVQEIFASQNHLLTWSSCISPGVRHLDLNHNALIRIDLETCVPKNLVHLKLSFNKIEHPPILPESVMYVDFSHNRLRLIPSVPSEVIEADFSKNSIPSLGRDTFIDARKLYELSLSHNLLKSIGSRQLVGLQELRILDLSHNEINFIHPHAFFALLRLEHIKLHHNFLVSLDPRIFKHFQANTRVDLHNNQWQCSCQLLNLLVKSSKAFCDPHCPKVNSGIDCIESGHHVIAEEVLETCKTAMEVARKASGESTKILGEAPVDDGSDEDLSEEVKSNRKQKSYRSYQVIPAVLVISIISALIFMSYRLYSRRRSVRMYLSKYSLCNCLEPSSNLQSHALPTDKMDSDSETEL